VLRSVARRDVVLALDHHGAALEVEKMLGVSKVTIYRWLREGFIVGQQLASGGLWHIRIDAATRAKVVPVLPEG
jgi:DNA invertase Pin-like site-specific DNA recombinase